MVPNERQIRSDGAVGCGLGGLIWLGGTVALFVVPDRGEVFAVALGIAVAVAIVREIRRRRWIQALVEQYVAYFGTPPPGFSARGAGLGWAAGSAVGSPVAGGLLGAAADLWRMHREQEGMSAQQRALHDQIKSLQAWSPFHGVYLIAIGLFLSAAAAWVMDVVRQP